MFFFLKTSVFFRRTNCETANRRKNAEKDKSQKYRLFRIFCFGKFSFNIANNKSIWMLISQPRWWKTTMNSAWPKIKI